jgi:hypothetical protein
MRERLSLLAVAASVVSLLGCSSSSGGGGNAGASNNFVCGNGSISGTGRATDPNGLAPVPNATASAPGCTTAVTDDRGYIQIATDPGLVIKLDVSASGHVNEHAEFAVLKDGFALTGYLFEGSVKSGLLPGWSDSQGYIAVLISSSSGGDGGSCTNDGVTVSVKGHPEIPASYLKDLSTLDPTLTATGSLGAAVLGPVPPGTYEVDGAKTGCTVSPSTGAYFQFQTTFAVAAGTLSLQSMQIGP